MWNKKTNWSNSDCANLAPMHFTENIALFSKYGHNLFLQSRDKSCLIDQKTSAQLNCSLINLSGKECKQGPFFLGSSRSRRQLFLPRRHQPKINVLCALHKKRGKRTQQPCWINKARPRPLNKAVFLYQIKTWPPRWLLK